MRAVNLIPGGSARGARGGPAGGSSIRPGPGHALLAGLAIALAFVTVYVLSANSISDRRVKLAEAQRELARAQAQAGQLTTYTSYIHLAEARGSTVRQIASSRFDWHAALTDLAHVFPVNARLQSLLATVAPGVTVSGAGGSTGGGGGASTSQLRGAVAAPAFELKGCTTSHDDVARLISRLRVINGVQRVTLADSVRAANFSIHGKSGSTTTSSAPGSAPTPVSVPRILGCGSRPASFDLVVFFQSTGAAAPLAGSSTTPIPSPVATPSAATPSAATPAAASASANSAASASGPQAVSNSSPAGTTK